MNREQTLPARPVLFVPTPTARTAAPVLIQVPRVATDSRPSARRARHAARTPRRRLRREVRWAAYVMLAVLPMALSAFAYREGRQAALIETKAARGEGDRAMPPLISLSIEPGAALSPVESEVPVVFPGYLLPDDGSEESAHAGD